MMLLHSLKKGSEFSLGHWGSEQELAVELHAVAV